LRRVKWKVWFNGLVRSGCFWKVRKETPLSKGFKSPFVPIGEFQMKRFFFALCALLCLGKVAFALPRDSLGMRLLTQTLLGPARQVVVQGTYAYVGVSCGLLILDVSDPANPVETGRAYITTRIEDIFVQSGYAYVADALQGLTIVDVRDVRNPRVVGKVRCGFNMFGVFVKDTLAYLVGSGGYQDSSDLFVINVKDPMAPFVVAGYDTSWGHKIQVVDSLAYVTAAGWNVSIEIFNISNPFDIRQIGQTSGIGTTEDIVVRDTLAFVASPDSGLCVVNIKDPRTPQKVVCYNPSGPPYAGPYSISVLGNYAYLCDDKGVYEGYPYRTLSYFWVVDISDPANPVELSSYVTVGSGGGVLAKDTLVYFADGGRGLRVIDVRNPFLPREITHFSTGDACWELVKQGDYLYVAHGGDGLRVLNVSNPAQPVEVGHLELPWRTFDIMLKDSLLYAAEGDSGLVVMDIRNPAQPQTIGRWSGLQSSEMAYGICVQDSLVYLSGKYGYNLWIVNVQDPRNPFFTGRWRSSSDGVYDLWVRGRYAYVPDGPPWTFHVVDVGDPYNPGEVYSCGWPAPGGRELEFADTLGYVLVDFRAPGDGFYVVSIGNPVRPDTNGGYVRSTGEDDLYGLHCFPPYYVWVGGVTHYFQTGESCGRMDLVDVSNPYPAQSIRHYETGWTISDVWGEGFNYAYGGAYLGNLFVFSVDSSVGVEREERSGLVFREPELEIRPNPVKGSCVIRYWSGREGKVRLTLYDVTGRVVRSFAPYALRLTPSEVYWDGRDDKGKEVRSGVYFLRAEGGGQALTKKFVVVR
jgi:hypothetical protein